MGIDVVLPNSHAATLPIGAACSGIKTRGDATAALFFIAEQCRRCPVTRECLGIGLMDEQADGVYGGVLLLAGEPVPLDAVMEEVVATVTQRPK